MLACEHAQGFACREISTVTLSSVLADVSLVPTSCACPCRKKARTSEWDTTEATPAVNRWDATPGRADEFGATPGRGGATPGLTPGHSRWDATPTPGRAGTEATPRRNRWDDATPTPGRVRP